MEALDNVIQGLESQLDVERLASRRGNPSFEDDWEHKLLKELETVSLLRAPELNELKASIRAMKEIAEERVFVLDHSLLQRIFEEFIHYLRLDLEIRFRLLQTQNIQPLEGQRTLVERLFSIFGPGGLLPLNVVDGDELRSFRADKERYISYRGTRIVKADASEKRLRELASWVRGEAPLPQSSAQKVSQELLRLTKGVDESSDIRPRSGLGAIIRIREIQRRALCRILGILRRNLPWE